MIAIGVAARMRTLRYDGHLCLLLGLAALAGCGGAADGDIPAASITTRGFLKGHTAVESEGRRIRLRGFVDQGNLYGDAGAQQILGEWWSGEGPDSGLWRFNLKAGPDDAVGQSFAVFVPTDAGRDALLRRIAADARAHRPTRVRVSGRLFTFDAPTQFRGQTGLYLLLQSSEDVRLDE